MHATNAGKTVKTYSISLGNAFARAVCLFADDCKAKHLTGLTFTQ